MADDLLAALPDVPIKFWLCPESAHRRTGIVQRVGNVAHCKEPGCGKTSADPVVFELDVPMLYAPNAHGPAARPCEPLSANYRLHWRPERERKKTVRDAIHYAAKKIGTARRITVQLHYRPGDNRRRDGSNLMPTQKPAVDGLVRAGVVPDDTAQYVTEHTPVIHPGPGPRRLWLTVEVTR